MEKSNSERQRFYRNESYKRFRLNFVVQFLVLCYLFITIEPIELAIKAVLIVGVFAVLSTYIVIGSLTWDVTLSDNKIEFSNKYKLFMKNNHVFYFKELDEVVIYLNSKGGATFKLTRPNIKTINFQEVGINVSLEIGADLKEKGVKVILFHSISNEEELKG